MQTTRHLHFFLSSPVLFPYFFFLPHGRHKPLVTSPEYSASIFQPQPYADDPSTKSSLEASPKGTRTPHLQEKLGIYKKDLTSARRIAKMRLNLLQTVGPAPLVIICQESIPTSTRSHKSLSTPVFQVSRGSVSAASEGTFVPGTTFGF